MRMIERISGCGGVIGVAPDGAHDPGLPLLSSRRTPPMTGWAGHRGSSRGTRRRRPARAGTSEKSTAAVGNRAALPSSITRWVSVHRIAPARRGEIGVAAVPAVRSTRRVVRSSRPPASGPRDADRNGARTTPSSRPSSTGAPAPPRRVRVGVRQMASSANAESGPKPHCERTASRSTVTARVSSRSVTGSQCSMRSATSTRPGRATGPGSRHRRRGAGRSARPACPSQRTAVICLRRGSPPRRSGSRRSTAVGAIASS